MTNKLELGEALISMLWIVGTFASWGAIIGLLIWVIGWGIRFKFWQTEAGLIMWSFSALLLALVLNSIIGNIGASTREWWQPSPNDFSFWYVTRAAINVSMLVVIVRMLNLLRKHWNTREPIRFEVPAREPRPRTGPTQMPTGSTPPGGGSTD